MALAGLPRRVDERNMQYAYIKVKQKMQNAYYFAKRHGFQTWQSF
jgi:hypothetical protein